MPEINISLEEANYLYEEIGSLKGQISSLNNEIMGTVRAMNNHWDDAAYDAFKERMNTVDKRNKETDIFLSNTLKKVNLMCNTLERRSKRTQGL